jgi:Ca-activated chloride channel family protein
MILIGVAVVILLIMAGLVWGQSLRMVRGNGLFKSGDFKKAREIYADLSVDEPKSPYVHHNLGLSYYKDNESEKTLENLRQAVKELEALPENTPSKKELLNKFYYHLGDGLFKNAAKAGGDQGQAANLYQEALQNFQKAVEANPGDQDAKYNYELTKLRLQEAKDQQQQNKNDQNKKDQDKQDKQDNQQQQDQKGNQKDKEQQNSKEEQAKKDKAKEEQAKQGQSGQKQDGKMTKEEAAALLKMAENGELYQGPIIMEKGASGGKDW